MNEEAKRRESPASRAALAQTENGLAATLTSSAAGNAASPTGGTAAGSDRDWMLFGIDTVAQLAAENAAHAAGQSVGNWLTELIAEAIKDENRG